MSASQRPQAGYVNIGWILFLLYSGNASIMGKSRSGCSVCQSIAGVLQL